MPSPIVPFDSINLVRTMNRDEINVRFVDIGHELTTITKPLKDMIYVEQLVNNILEDQGVGPVYRLLFGLRLVKQSIWFAPNVKIEELLELINKFSHPSDLELRMRFMPSSFRKCLVLDRTVFELAFAQIRYDFIHTKFTDEKRDFILFNDSVLSLITVDLLRYSLEHLIDVNDVFGLVNPNDFIPHRASKWQRSLLFRLKEKFNLQKSIQAGYRKCDKDVVRIKQKFMELFLYEVCKDYGAETYKVTCLDNPSDPQSMEVRIRFNQTYTDTSCIIENRLALNRSKDKTNWTELCDIFSICYGTLRDDAAEINRSNGRPFRAKFQSDLHAKSFLWLIDGYYRLMRKWHFNFCRDVSSPELDNLLRMKSHGPIGYETMRMKLTKLKKPGTYLIRSCMEKNNRYLIDVLFQSGTRLTIDIDWKPNKMIYTMADFCSHTTINTTMKVSVISARKEYSDLKTLINETQIKIDDGSNNYPPLQLKYLLPPSEYDDCPSLLLLIPDVKLKDFDGENEGRHLRSSNELPRLIPDEMIQYSKKLPLNSGNKMIVKFANLNGEQNVIVKHHIDDKPECQYSESKDLILDLCCKGQSHPNIFNNLKPAQLRLADWIFVKNPLFAETFGIDLTRNSLIQEYFPLGRLDRFLGKSTNVTEVKRRSISCQLAQALLFLQDRHIIHGKLRCHNIYMSSLHPIKIKITDPLGTFNAEKDLAFLPPEYFALHGQVCIREYDHGIDVWALGTTLWQIYNKGRRPPARRYANTLIQPPGCPDEVWSLIESCWIVEPTSRASPQKIYRDLNDSFAWERETHDYDYISHADPESIQATFPDSETTLSRGSNCESRLGSNESGGSSNGSGSQMNLIRPLNVAISDKTVDPNRAPKMERLESTVNSPMSTKKKVARGWKRLFKGSSSAPDKKTTTNGGEQNIALLGSSKMSVSTCSTPSGSETTKVTELADAHSISNELDCTMWRIDSSKLKLGSVIGKGSCGVVVKGVLSQTGGISEQVVAVKCINAGSGNSDDSSLTDDLKREFEILKSLNHDNIVKTLGFVDETTMMLVVEYMPLGSLLACLKNSHHEHLLSLPLQKYANDIAKGMAYLESMKIVHRDLALRNILVKSRNEVKICDFGLAHFLGPDNHYKLKTDRALPLRWYAPEALNTWTFSHKTDVWSYGIVLWEIYSGGSSPQYSGTYADLSETLKHERLLMPTDCPHPMYNLMLSCWAYNPEDRDSFPQICEKLAKLPDTSTLEYRESNRQLY